MRLLRMENNKYNIYNYEQTLRGDKTHATRVTSLLQGKQQDTTASRGPMSEKALLRRKNNKNNIYNYEQLFR